MFSTVALRFTLAGGDVDFYEEDLPWRYTPQAARTIEPGNGWGSSHERTLPTQTERRYRMKIYVASSWRNERQPEVVKALREELPKRPGFPVDRFQRRPRDGLYPAGRGVQRG